jgi:hypothetical protein
MKHSRLVLAPAVLLALTLVAEPARASVATTTDSVTVAPILSRTDDARMKPTVRAQVEQHRTRASAARQAGDVALASQEYLAAAALMREAGVLPVKEMRGAAEIAAGQGRPQDAAAMLDTLAADAKAFGVELEHAQALADAAEQYVQAGELDVARDRLSDLRMMLVSPPYPPAGYRTNVQTSAVAVR